jgi:hypothetical protein
MQKSPFVALVLLAISTTSALACSADDVQARQGALLVEMQSLLVVDPAKAQDIIVKMQSDLEQATANNDEAAPCKIMDAALAQAKG